MRLAMFNAVQLQSQQCSSNLECAYPQICVGGACQDEQPQSVDPNAGSVLRQGMSGQLVRDLQASLNGAGFSVSVDGIFGAETVTAVKSLQSWAGLAVDGVVGPQTWAALGSASAAPAAVVSSPAPAQLQADATRAIEAGIDPASYLASLYSGVPAEKISAALTLAVAKSRGKTKIYKYSAGGVAVGAALGYFLGGRRPGSAVVGAGVGAGLGALLSWLA